MRRADCRSYGWLAAIFLIVLLSHDAVASNLDFKRETLSFANYTVFAYDNGLIRQCTGARKKKPARYTRRCFVMSGTVLQFHKFARFDPKRAPLNDKELAARVRAV